MKRLLLVTAALATTAAALNGQANSRPKADSTCTKYSDGRITCTALKWRVFGDSGAGGRVFVRIDSLRRNMDSVMAKRAALGIELRPTGTRRDTLGIFVAAVTPKGPAESAGIVEGDRIAAVNGVDVRSSAADIDDPYTNGLASHRLTREVQKLTPGSRVTLRVWSAGRYRDVQVVAGKATDVMKLSNQFFRMPGPGGMMEFNGPGFDGMMLREPLMRGQMLREPMLRGEMFQRFRSLPRVQLRTRDGARELLPSKIPDGPMVYELDDDPL